jgi:release factor glutamine methyltransferase
MDGHAQTLDESLGGWIQSLRLAGCATPRGDVETIVAEALSPGPGDSPTQPSREVSPATIRLIEERIHRRAQREPLEYILGRCCFRGLCLLVDPRVAIPQPDSEMLVEFALELPRGARVHDVGTGSGAIGLAVKHERPDLVVSGSDVSPAAIAVAKANANRLNLAVHLSVAPGIPEGQYDLVLANLPYLDDGCTTMPTSPEVSHYEPHIATFAGVDGLAAIEAVIQAAPSGLRVALEHAPSHAMAVRQLLDSAHTRSDNTGQERYTCGHVPRHGSS